MAFQAKKLRRGSDDGDCGSCSSANSQSVSTEHSSTERSNFTQMTSLHMRDSFEFPNDICNWERKHIEKLNFQTSFVRSTPIQLINKNHDDLLEFDKEMLEMKLDLIEKSDFTRFLDSLEYMYSTFDNFRVDKPSPENACQWEIYLDDKYSFAPKEVPEDFKFWFSRFNSFAKEFAHRLYDILRRKEENRPIHKSHFQFLFSSFVSAFGMLCGTSFAPCLEKQTLTIGDCEIAGVPDIVFSCNSPAEATEQRNSRDRVVVVCEVTKDSPQSEKKSRSSSSGQTRGRTNPKGSNEAELVTTTHEASSSATEQDSDRQMCHWKISDKLIGQHGGALLLNFPNSFRRNIAMGLIVQQTQVSFSVLDMTREKFEEIVHGDLEHQKEDRPILTVTRPYDIFKKEDRKHLIKPFIKFADFQRQ